MERETRILDGIEWVWFDLDDTLYDFKSSSLVALEKVYEDYRLSRLFPGLQQWIDCYHRHNSALWQQYNRAEVTQWELRRARFMLPLTEAGMDASEAEEMWETLDRDYLRILGETGLLIEGADEALRHLRSRGKHIGVLSNGFRDVQHRKLQSSGIEGLVDCVVLSDDAGVNKPDARIFEYAMKAAMCSPETSLMIGDNPETDISGALASGWKAVLLYAEPKSECRELGFGSRSVTAIESLREILKW